MVRGILVLLASVLCSCATRSPPTAVLPAKPPPLVSPPTDSLRTRTTETAALTETAVKDLTPEGPRVPTDCAERRHETCLPDESFAKRICERTDPGAALAMFAKGTPWTRLYLRGNVEAWYASGGSAPSSLGGPVSPSKLVFDEEVIVLRKRGGSPDAMMVSGSSNYDTLRWDGSCVSLDEGEVTRKLPPKPKTALVPFQNLDEPIQNALLEDKKILRTYRERRRQCQAISLGEPSNPCVKANQELTRAVTEYLRKGGQVPEPEYGK